MLKVGGFRTYTGRARSIHQGYGGQHTVTTQQVPSGPRFTTSDYRWDSRLLTKREKRTRGVMRIPRAQYTKVPEWRDALMKEAMILLISRIRSSVLATQGIV